MDLSLRWKTESNRIDKYLAADALLVFAAALLLRWSWAFLSPDLDPFLQGSLLHGDAASYDLLARNVLRGDGYTLQPPQPSAFWPPLYPMFLGLIYQLANYELLVVRLVQALLGAVVPVLFYLIGRRLVNRRVALLTGLGLALYPHLIYFGNWIIAESLFLFLFSLALWLMVRWRKSLDAPGLLVIGVLFGLCTLAKPATLFILPFLALWLLLNGRSESLGRRIRPVVLLALFTFLTILPWTIRNARAMGQPVLVSTNGGYTFLGANNPSAWGGHDEGFPPRIPNFNDAQADEIYYRQAVEWIREEPGAFIGLLRPKLLRLFSPLSVASYRQDYQVPGSTTLYVMYALFLLAALAGAALSAQKWRSLGLLYAPIISVVLSAALFYGDARYTIPMIPSLVFFAAVAIDRLPAPWRFARR